MRPRKEVLHAANKSLSATPKPHLAATLVACVAFLTMV
jgi:hypothetical protein